MNKVIYNGKDCGGNNCQHIMCNDCDLFIQKILKLKQENLYRYISCIWHTPIEYELVPLYFYHHKESSYSDGINVSFYRNINEKEGNI